MWAHSIFVCWQLTRTESFPGKAGNCPSKHSLTAVVLPAPCPRWSPWYHLKVKCWPKPVVSELERFSRFYQLCTLPSNDGLNFVTCRGLTDCIVKKQVTNSSPVMKRRRRYIVWMKPIRLFVAMLGTTQKRSSFTRVIIQSKLWFW